MVNDIAKIAQANNSDQYTSVSQDMALRKQGLECTVTIMKSLVEWSRDLSVSTVVVSKQEEQPESITSAASTSDAQSPPPTEVDVGAAEISENDVEAFKKQKQLKSIMEEGRNKFNNDPKSVGFSLLMYLSLRVLLSLSKQER